MQTSGASRREIADACWITVIASEAKQSILSPRCGMDCFASLAMTDSGVRREQKCYPSLNSSYPFAATSSHRAR